MDNELGANPLVPPTASPMESLFRVDIGDAIGADFVPLANDVARMICIQVAIQVMLVLSGARDVSFFSSDFLLLVFFTALGVMLYWLAVRKLVVFT